MIAILRVYLVKYIFTHYDSPEFMACASRHMLVASFFLSSRTLAAETFSLPQATGFTAPPTKVIN